VRNGFGREHEREDEEEEEETGGGSPRRGRATGKKEVLEYK
jgi:hypothetical protein